MSEEPVDGEYTFAHLQPDESYEFRVAAINVAGQGPWSESSEPCIPAKSVGMFDHDFLTKQSVFSIYFIKARSPLLNEFAFLFFFLLILPTNSIQRAHAQFRNCETEID